MSNLFSIGQELNAEASDYGSRSISPTQHTQPSPATSPSVLKDNSNPTVLLTDAAASLAAATTTTESNLMTEDSRMNLDNNVNESTNKGEGPDAISNITDNQPPPAAGNQNNTLTNVSHLNPATGNNDSNPSPSFNDVYGKMSFTSPLTLEFLSPIPMMSCIPKRRYL
jgi:hypothetical protein